MAGTRVNPSSPAYVRYACSRKRVSLRPSARSGARGQYTCAAGARVGGDVVGTGDGWLSDPGISY